MIKGDATYESYLSGGRLTTISRPLNLFFVIFNTKSNKSMSLCGSSAPLMGDELPTGKLQQINLIRYKASNDEFENKTAYIDDSANAFIEIRDYLIAMYEALANE